MLPSLGYEKIKDAEDPKICSLSIENESNDIEKLTTSHQHAKPFGSTMKYGVGALAVVSLGIIAALSLISSSPKLTAVDSNGVQQSLFDSYGRYVLRDFDSLKPMSNFLAGLGGLWGVPMWAFYVNRGQGITSFGIQNKDGAISKFNTAEKAYQETPFTGFRTFLKGRKAGSSWTHMPFFPLQDRSRDIPTRNMMIGMNEMEIEETSISHGLKTNVLYFTVPDEDFPCLVRRTTFTNLDEWLELDLDVLDGLGRLIPSGLSNGALDGMGRTMEAWMNVYNLDEGDLTHPFFHISQGTADTATVQIIKDGHFAVSFVEREDQDSDISFEPLPFIVDPSVVFGTDTTLTDPSGFFQDSDTFEHFMRSPQGTTSRTPCAFAGAALKIAGGKSVTITSVYGHAKTVEEFVTEYSPKLRAGDFVAKKRIAANSLVDSITEKVATSTSSSLFDGYVKQDFLDNVLRGGLPIPLGDPSDPKIYHTYSRIHGDIERDYNFYQIDTTYFSQGPGNFRDVNQNRRLDVFHTPVVGDFNIRMFLSLVQYDGYNPLTVATTNFKIPASDIGSVVSSLCVVDELGSTKNSDKMAALLAKPFRVGQLFKDMDAASITYTVSREELLNKVVAAAEQVFAAQYAQNGYWADHWTYTLDLVENYLSIFPDKEEVMLWESEQIPFFMSPSIVKSRLDRYSLVDNFLHPGTGSSTIKVFNAVSTIGDAGFPPERKTAMSAIWGDFVADSAGAGGAWQRDKDGHVFTVTAVAKLAILGILKFSTLDPYGMGVEMEGGKPGWNDAMNGLPGIIGSGMPETYEMLRVLRYVKSAVATYNRGVVFPVEFSDFISSLDAALATYSSSGKTATDDFAYWDASNTAREKYREAVVSTFLGTTTEIAASDLLQSLEAMELKTLSGIEKALATNAGLSPTYFFYECTSYEMVASTQQLDSSLPPPPTKVEAKAFKLHKLPLFLEGPTRHFKVLSDDNARAEIYERTKGSNLYDEPLKMFTISESLKGMSQDIGRMMAFSAGWLENQSVWLHMSYKFYLEMLRAGLYDAFFAEIKTGLVPFMDNSVYGRSPLEASSFIVSSAFPDAKLHGAGFLARLSGSTAEFLSMWALMMAGPKPFILSDGGELQLKLTPILPGWLFTDKGTVSFTFLGSVLVTYHNPSRVDTWKITPTSVVVKGVDGTSLTFGGGVIDSATATLVRSQGVKSISIYY